MREGGEPHHPDDGGDDDVFFDAVCEPDVLLLDLDGHKQEAVVSKLHDAQQAAGGTPPFQLHTVLEIHGVCFELEDSGSMRVASMHVDGMLEASWRQQHRQGTASGNASSGSGGDSSCLFLMELRQLDVVAGEAYGNACIFRITDSAPPSHSASPGGGGGGSGSADEEETNADSFTAGNLTPDDA